jgi:hypothetical protein
MQREAVPAASRGVPVPLLGWLGAEKIEGWRENSSTATLGAHPVPEWRDLLQGFDTHILSKAGGVKRNRVCEQRSSEVPNSHTLTSE